MKILVTGGTGAAGDQYYLVSQNHNIASLPLYSKLNIYPWLESTCKCYQ